MFAIGQEISFRDRSWPRVGRPTGHFYEDFIFSTLHFFHHSPRVFDGRNLVFTRICAASGTAFHRDSCVLKFHLCAVLPRKRGAVLGQSVGSLIAFSECFYRPFLPWQCWRKILQGLAQPWQTGASTFAKGFQCPFCLHGCELAGLPRKDARQPN